MAMAQMSFVRLPVTNATLRDKYAARRFPLARPV